MSWLFRSLFMPKQLTPFKPKMPPSPLIAAPRAVNQTNLDVKHLLWKKEMEEVVRKAYRDTLYPKQKLNLFI